MQYVETKVKDFNLDHIFDCGQCFRWEREADGSYTGVAMGSAVNMRLASEPTDAGDKDGGAGDEGGGRITWGRTTEGGTTEKTLIIDNCPAEDFDKKWRNYLDLDRDYGKIKAGLLGEQIQKAAEYGYGIRILRQEFWESLISFIISQNNNIPRIKGCIESLAENFGEKICDYRGKTYYALPEAERLAELSEKDLAICRLGYRAPYLIKTAQKVLENGGTEAVEAKLRACGNFDEAEEALREYPGVGPKVASCIALFGLGFLEAFPIDVWMRRVMNRLYGMEEKDVRSMSLYAKENFGEYGGIAQQYLFYYIRGLEK